MQDQHQAQLNTHQLNTWMAALSWYLDAGVDVAFDTDPVDRTIMPALPVADTPATKPDAAPPQHMQTRTDGAGASFIGASEARTESLKRALAAQNLDELRNAIAGFDGLSLKHTATNMVFAAGNPSAPIMVLGDAPESEDDRTGHAFVGPSGQLLDKMLAAINLTRENDVYIANILNWRPPGNRTPASAEIDVCLPFIERHIALVRPKLLVFAGEVAARALLGRSEPLSRLRGQWHDYVPQTPEMRQNAAPIPALALYHPTVLLRTPAQKRAAWADLLTVQAKANDLGLFLK